MSAFADEPDCWMCTNQRCLQCYGTDSFCEHGYIDRHTYPDGEFHCDDPPRDDDRAAQAQGRKNG